MYQVRARSYTDTPSQINERQIVANTIECLFGLILPTVDLLQFHPSFCCVVTELFPDDAVTSSSPKYVKYFVAQLPREIFKIQKIAQ